MAFLSSPKALLGGELAVAAARPPRVCPCCRVGLRRSSLSTLPLRASAAAGEEPPSTAPGRDTAAQSPRPEIIEPVAREKLWAEIRGLETSLDIAVKAERFGDAATIRDEIAAMEARDPHVWLSAELDRAVSEERFEEAARLRDELKAASPPPSKEVVSPQSREKLSKATKVQKRMLDWAISSEKRLPTISETSEQGIKVQINAFYIPEKSVPEKFSYVFGYRVHVSIENGAASGTAQLIRRHWKIQQLDGDDSEVRGNGVVGEQPVLEPGDDFDYLSACPLKFSDVSELRMVAGEERVIGCMSGEYTFASGPTGATFIEVPVDPIYFVLPGDAVK